jgi:hypothetical protein
MSLFYKTFHCILHTIAAADCESIANKLPHLPPMVNASIIKTAVPHTSGILGFIACTAANSPSTAGSVGDPFCKMAIS